MPGGAFVSDVVTALDVVELALTDPRRACVVAGEILARRPAESDAILALRARGLARRHLGQVEASAVDLNEALERADELGDDQLWAGVGLSLAGTLVHQGRVDDAKALLERCISCSTGEPHVEAIYQLGTTCVQAGDLEAGLGYYAEALPSIRALDRPTWEGNLLGNRGVLNILRGQYDEAIRDLDAAIRLHAVEGPSMFLLHRDNKAYALLQRGDVAAAIDLYEANDRLRDQHDVPMQNPGKQGSAYLAAGLFEEAMALAQRAHRRLTQGHAVLGAIEALLPGAEAALALGNFDLAVRLSDAALELDEEGAFPSLSARAQLVRIEVRLRSGTSQPADADTAATLADTISDQDIAVSARSSLLQASVALAHSDGETAWRVLSVIDRQKQLMPLHLQIEQATMRARCAAADNTAVLAAATDGLAAFDELVGGVEAYNVRYKATRHAGELADLAAKVLVGRRDVGTAIEIIERVRAGAVDMGNAAEARAPAEVRADESYVVWCDLDDRLVCLVLEEGSAVLHHCGELTTVRSAVERHRFTYRQLAHSSRLGDRSRHQISAAALEADAVLGDLILPVDLRSRVVLNPSATLGPVVWGALPALTHRTHTVAPSFAIARRQLPSAIRSVRVLGASELPHVPAEVAAIAHRWGVRPDLDPGRDTIEQLAGVDLLHAAGHYRADAANPLFSELPLGELRLRGSDYLELRPPPKIAVLSGCASGLGESVAGAMVGFSSAALAAGTASVVATQTVIEDGPPIVSAMTRFHDELSDGTMPADALRRLRESAPDTDRSALAALVVIGAGW